MEEDRAANQRSGFPLSFTLALYISNEFGLRRNPNIVAYQTEYLVYSFGHLVYICLMIMVSSPINSLADCILYLVLCDKFSGDDSKYQLQQQLVQNLRRINYNINNLILLISHHFTYPSFRIRIQHIIQMYVTFFLVAFGSDELVTVIDHQSAINAFKSSILKFFC